MSLYDELLDEINRKINQNREEYEATNMKSSFKRKAYNVQENTNAIRNSILPTRQQYTPSESVNNNVNLPIAKEFKSQLENGKRVEPSEEYSLPVFANRIKKDALPMASKVIGGSLLDNMSYVGKKTGVGVAQGTTGIGQAFATEMANSFKKGNQKTGNELLQDVSNSMMLNPISDAKDMFNTMASSINPNKSFWENVGSLGTNIVSGTVNKLPIKKQIDAVNQVVGKILPNNASDVVMATNNAISKPIENLNEKLDEEGQPYWTITQTLGNVGQVVGNMVPSIAVGAVTKNPNMALATMGMSTKGQSTQEALSKGASLEQAIKIGDTKAMIEVGTEMLTGGVNIFGKGAIDKIVEKGINKKVKNEVLNFLTKKGIDFVGEVGEEVISDILGTVVDRGTVDPNASYSWKDFGDTAITTILSTLVLNALGGGYTKRAYNENVQNMKDYNVQQKLQEAQDIIDNVQNKPNNVLEQQINQGQNKMAQNGNIGQINDVLNNREMPIQSYQYEKSDNAKIDNLRQDMSKYWANTDKVKALGATIEKIIQDEGYNVRLDNNITNKNGQFVNAQVSTLSNGEVEIKINPNAKNVGEFLLMHETTHAIETQEMKNLVLDYAKKNKGFNEALESLKKTYGTEDVSSEVVADISGQLFGNQEFINSLSMEKPSVFKRIYNKIIELANKITGNSHEALFIRDLKNKWEEAYRTQNNNLNNNSYYSIQQDSHGNRYVKVDTDQDIFKGKSPNEYTNIAKDYILNKYRDGSKQIALPTKESVNVTRKTANEYTHPKKQLPEITKQSKMKASTELDNLLEVSKYQYSTVDDGRHTFAKDGWDYYKTIFEVNGIKFEGLVNLAKNGNKKTLYDITKIKRISQNHSTSDKSFSVSLTNSNNSILPTNKNVNSTDRYSMQNTEKNSLSTKEWTEHLNDNYNATGTRTDLADIKVPTKEYFENKETAKFLSDEDLNVLNKIYEKEGSTEVFTEKKKAKILERYAKDKYSFKDSLDMLAQKIVNKGHYVDELSKSSKNPELKFMYDRNLNSFAEGQYVIGIAQTDNNGNAIGKSINDIWKPVEDSKLSKEFDEYLLHKLNIDRAEKNKYVFGEDIKPADSTAIALDLESKHPEFKEWAKDIKEFNHNNMLNLKEAGLIDQDTINYLESMYPNYVPISRTIDEQIFTGNVDKTGTASPIKSATGGNADIQPVKDAMAMQAIRIKRLINQNNLGIELSKSLKNSKVDAGFDTTLTPSVLLEMDTLIETDSSGNKFYVYFEDGKMQKLKINDELYKSLKPTEISDIERTLPAKMLQKLTNINRSLLTSSNPLFIVTNFFKDFQDGMFNSKYSSKFIKNYGKALHEIVTNGKYYESYMANGGMTNSYFDYEEGVKKKHNKFVERIRGTNEIVEQLPRLAEFISTLEDGKSLNEALYNAAEITTNFKRGGEWTKTLNRNGATFLNASVQGFDKFYRNFSGQNGAKGYINLAIKATLLGVVPSVLNHMLLDDDEDYQDLPQSTKDLYYLFKYDDGKFIRIPKGRMLSVFGAVARRIVESTQGQDDAWNGLGNTIINQIAPNNPVEDNIFAPISAVASNKTWYGSDLVSSRLQKELPKNQYDETTDEFSKWLGNKLNVSPKKINYLLDQYSGGIGDVLLPMITPQAKENVFIDKFTTDSVLKNKNVSKFYDTLDKQTQIANDSFATDEDQLQLKYLNEMSQDIGKLYKEKRDIQMSSVSQAEKKDKVRVVQGKIDALCEEALNNYKDVKVEGNTAKSKFSSFYKDTEGKWKELTETENSKNKDISLKSYADYKNAIYEKKQSKIKSGQLKKGQDLKDKDKIQVLLDSNYSNKEISAIYENYILSSNDKSFKAIKASGIDIKEYLKYVQQEFKADKTDDGTTKGKSVSNSKKVKEYGYVNNMNISYEQRLLLLGFNYNLNNTEKSKLAEYVNNLNGLNKKERMDIFEKLNGFSVYKDGRIKW